MIEIVQGVVLRAEDSGEVDKQLTLYTKELGKLKTKIIGVKKSGSKLNALSIPFVESRLQIYVHGSHRVGLHTPGKIIGGEILDCHIPLRSHWDRIIQCSTFCEILDSLTHPLYPNAKEYQLLVSTLQQIERTNLPVLARLRSTLILLKILGYSLSYHSTWKTLSDENRQIFKRLARWDFLNEPFNQEEIYKLEKMIGAYLSLYLPSPLKTALFQKKIQMAETY